MEPEQSEAHVKQLYDQRYADNYMDTDAYSTWGHGELRTRQVLETLRLVEIRPKSILDYGCGVGAWLGLLSHAFPRARLHGVDISEVAICKARQRYPDCRLESFDGFTAPFADGQFDLIFSYHVLEHVTDVDRSVWDISRLLAPGGYAVIIFPCGNPGSFLDKMMSLMRDSRLPADHGRKVLFFETADGHVRRMTSEDTVELFRRHGLEVMEQRFSGHFFGTLDWLIRGTGPAYINQVFRGRPPKSLSARLRLEGTRRVLIGLHRAIRKKSLDIRKRRNPAKQAAVRIAYQLAVGVDRALDVLNAREWARRQGDPAGTAQYLVFRKS